MPKRSKIGRLDIDLTDEDSLNDLLAAIAMLGFQQGRQLSFSNLGDITDLIGSGFTDPATVTRNRLGGFFGPQPGPIQFLGGFLQNPEPGATIEALGALIDNFQASRRLLRERQEGSQRGSRRGSPPRSRASSPTTR